MKTIAIVLSLICVPAAFSGLNSERQPRKDPLVSAITSSNWSWEEFASGAKRVEAMQFSPNGMAENTRFHWTARWEVAGDHILALENITPGGRFKGHKAYLVFDAAYTHFVGFDFNGKTTIEGFPQDTVDSKKKAPEQELRQ
jgi:hypothetical protein